MRLAAGNESDQFFNRLTNRYRVGNSDHTGHRLSLSYSFIGMFRNGFEVTRDKNASLLSSPRQEWRILCPLPCRILHHDTIECWITEPYPAQNLVIEVLVNQKAEHSKKANISGLAILQAAITNLCTEGRHVWTTFYRTPQLSRGLSLFAEI